MTLNMIAIACFFWTNGLLVGVLICRWIDKEKEKEADNGK